MRALKRNDRGMAVITVLMLTLLISFSGMMLLSHVQSQMGQSDKASRTVQAYACADNGLQAARRFYGNNYKNWNTYLQGADADGVVVSPDPISLAGEREVTFRDNVDELDVNDARRDNDLSVIIRSKCLKAGLAGVWVEGILTYAAGVDADQYAQVSGSTLRSGNLNR